MWRGEVCVCLFGFLGGEETLLSVYDGDEFLQGDVGAGRRILYGTTHEREKNEMHWGACWLGKDEQALQRVQHGWRYRYRYGHRYRYIGAMAGEERVGLTRASGFILFWSATKARNPALWEPARVQRQHSIVPAEVRSDSKEREYGTAESDPVPVTLRGGGVAIGLFPS